MGNSVPGSAPGCRAGNGEKLSSTQAEPGQANKSAVAYFPSISGVTSWRRSRYSNWLGKVQIKLEGYQFCLLPLVLVEESEVQAAGVLLHTAWHPPQVFKALHPNN